MTAIPAAFEPPSLGKAWDLSVKHLVTFLVVAVAALVVGGIAYLVMLLLGLTSSFALQAVIGSGSSDGASLAFLIGQAVGWIGSLPFVMIWCLLLVLLSAIPAVYFSTGEEITPAGAFKLLMQRPWHYIWAGIVFTVAVLVGSVLCYLPGLVVAFVGPVYINKIFTTELGAIEALRASFNAVYGSEHRWAFIGIQILVGLVAGIAYSCSCGLLGFLAIPAASFYIQNVAYRRGILS